MRAINVLNVLERALAGRQYLVGNRVALLTNASAINVNVPTFNRTAMAQPLTFGIDLSFRMGR